MTAYDNDPRGGARIRLSDFGDPDPQAPRNDDERERVQTALSRYPNLAVGDIGDIAGVPEGVVLGVQEGM